MFGRSSTETDPSTTHPDSAAPEKRWNTVSTLQAGPVADVDDRGAVYPRTRAVSVELWFGHGERWVRGGPGDGLRQTRLDGLPIIETRQKLDDGDVVQTAWADESGDGQGRVIVELANTTNVSVVVAVVVRPKSLGRGGRISSARVAGSLIVIDKLPLVELGRVPGAVVTAVDDGADAANLLDQLELSETEISGTPDLDSPDGCASIAAIIPLTRGATRQIEILEGREEVVVAPAPLDTVQAGWKAHLRATPDIDLPGWPKHLPAALFSSLLGSTALVGRPLGDRSWKPIDDSIRVVALSRAGLDWAAAHVADALLAGVTEGQIGREHWPAMAAVVGSISHSPEGEVVLSRHGDAVAAVAGHALSKSRTPRLVAPLVDAVGAAHGADASMDAAGIVGTMTNPDDGLVYVRHGFGVAEESAGRVAEELAKKNPPSAESVGLAMAASASTDFVYEPLVPMRSLAGSTWSWSRNGNGDSPHARASLLVGLMSLCVSDLSNGTIDVFPGASSRWLGQKVAFTNMLTSAGRLSVALRWHGERAAMLWELDRSGVGDIDRAGAASSFSLRCSSLDPNFSTSEPSGEALLAVPQKLIDQRDAAASEASVSSKRSLL